MPNECVMTVTDDQFEDEVLRNSGTVLVDFFTPWCPPCRKVAPILEELCAEKRSQLKIVKVDASESVKAAVDHNVSAVPTFVLFHGGKKVSQISGYQTKAQFERWIASSVGNSRP